MIDGKISVGTRRRKNPGSWPKQGFFALPAYHSPFWKRSSAQLALFNSLFLRRRNRGKVGIMPGFWRIMPGFHGRTVLPCHSPDHATVGEVVMGISVKDIFVLMLTGGLHRKPG
jgi:hypothetical protein